MIDSIVNAVLAHNGLEAGVELKHYGVKGMKWGVITGGASGKPGKASREASEDHVNSRVSASKKPYQMSTAELKRLNERLQLERANRELQARGPLQKIKTGTAIAGTILAVGTTVTTAYNFANSPAGKALAATVKKAFDNA